MKYGKEFPGEPTGARSGHLGDTTGMRDVYPEETTGIPSAQFSETTEAQDEITANRRGMPVARPGTAGSWKHRRSGRLSKQIPIVIIGADEEGRVFSEETHTVVVSLHGAGIVSRNRLMAEQELILRAVGNTQEVETRVVGEIGTQGAMHTYGVTFVDEDLEYWDAEFPPAPEWEERPLVLTLECSSCKDVVHLKNGDFEYDICTIHGGLARFCNECGFLTVWRRSQEVMPVIESGVGKAWKADVKEAGVSVAEAEPETVSQPRPQPKIEETKKTEVVVTLADAMEGTERRARARAKVNFHACVRTEAFGEEIVRCIDMSRGGVSFKSVKAYKKDMWLTIAVPYSTQVKDAPAIFVQGRIANAKEVGGEGIWRYGVEFIR
jgi:PilZ domain